MKKLIKKIKTLKWRIVSFFAMHFYGNPSKKLKIVGVTGTNGKTTTATLLYKIAIDLGYKAGLIGTLENVIVGEKRPATHTTPDSIALTKLLKEMLDRGCEYVFMEVSSHALDQNRVTGLHFSGGIFTNLTHDHLDYHKSIENYFNAKKKFFKMLSREAFALTNSDDGHGEMMLLGINAGKFSYGFNGGKNFHGEIKKIDFNGLELEINQTIIKSKLLGKFNAYNLLAVYGASDLLGFDKERVKKILENIEPPRGRFEHFVSPNNVLVIIDYPHTPDPLENLLKTPIKIKPPGHSLISVFGCGGDRDPLKRRIMGRSGATLSDIAIFTSDNPRSDDPDKIISEIRTDLSVALSQKVIPISNRREAIKEGVKMARPSDIILCAGKGHEDYQDIKGVKHHFNDIEEFKKAFNI